MVTKENLSFCLSNLPFHFLTDPWLILLQYLAACFARSPIGSLSPTTSDRSFQSYFSQDFLIHGEQRLQKFSKTLKGNTYNNEWSLRY